MTMKNAHFLAVTPCSLLEIYGGMLAAWLACSSILKDRSSMVFRNVGILLMGYTCFCLTVWPFLKVSTKLWVICNPQRYFPGKMWVPCLVESCCSIDRKCEEERRPLQLGSEISTDVLPYLKAPLVLFNSSDIENCWALGPFLSRVGWTVDLFRWQWPL